MKWKKKIAILCPHTFESNLYWINDVDWSKVIDCFGQSQIYWIINSHITFFAGNPLPKVTWWLEGLMIDSSDFVTRNGVIINQLVYKSLQRDDLFKMFDCQASNTNRTHPVSRKVKIILNCKWIYFKNKSDLSLMDNAPSYLVGCIIQKRVSTWNRNLEIGNYCLWVVYRIASNANNSFIIYFFTKIWHHTLYNIKDFTFQLKC